MTWTLLVDPDKLQKVATEAGDKAINQLHKKGIPIYGVLCGQMVEWLPNGKVRSLKKDCEKVGEWSNVHDFLDFDV